jgi:hypothetical protein
MSQKSSAPPTRVPTLKLVRDIRLATRKLHSAEDKIRIAGWVRILECDDITLHHSLNF